MSRRPYSLVLLMILALSCGRVRKAGHEVVNGAKDKVKEKRDQLIEKVFPRFDSDTPDTKVNKKRFRDFLGFPPTPDINQLYCWDDAIGIDAAYYFAFHCHDSTLRKIVVSLRLQRDTVAGKVFYGGLFIKPTPWWDTASIYRIKPYYKVDMNNYWYLWFEPKTGRTFFFTYDT